jgi:hypothetical protein
LKTPWVINRGNEEVDKLFSELAKVGQNGFVAKDGNKLMVEGVMGLIVNLMGGGNSNMVTGMKSVLA